MFFELDVGRGRCSRTSATSSGRAPRDMGALPRLPDRPAAALRAGGPGRRALRALVVLLHRQPTRRRARCSPSSAHVGPPRGRTRRPDALPGAQQRVRRPAAARAAALLEGRLRARAHRRRHRGPPGARPEGARRRTRRCTCTRSTAPSTTCPSTPPRSPTATPLRTGHRRDVAGPGGQRAQHGWVRDYHEALEPHTERRRLHQLHGRGRPGTDPRQLRPELRPAAPPSSRPSTPTTCST